MQSSRYREPMSRKIVGSLALPAGLLAPNVHPRSPGLSSPNSSFDPLNVFHPLYLCNLYVTVLAISRIINSPNTRSSSRQLFTMLLLYMVQLRVTRVYVVVCCLLVVLRSQLHGTKRSVVCSRQWRGLYTAAHSSAGKCQKATETFQMFLWVRA